MRRLFYIFVVFSRLSEARGLPILTEQRKSARKAHENGAAIYTEIPLYIFVIFPRARQKKPCIKPFPFYRQKLQYTMCFKNLNSCTTAVIHRCRSIFKKAKKLPSSTIAPRYLRYERETTPTARLLNNR